MESPRGLDRFRVLVWGGYGADRALTDGGIYNPSDDTWRPITSDGSPVGSARSGYTAVWTGSEMVVWGGINAYDNGARYNPVSNTWRSIATAGAPILGAYHTAVWTGTEMLVWGGVDARWQGNTYLAELDSGGRYNPTSDTWLPIPTQNAPSKRSYHCAVWTGSEMLVWGGTYSERPIGFGAQPRTATYEDGGRFNPSSGGWVPFGTPAAITPRDSHSAVWTGDTMLIWGGIGFMRDGAKYDPVANSLSPFAQAPITGRVAHATVWSGREMIVWGGGYDDNNGFRVLDDGARYDPQQNRWTLVPANGAPKARLHHSSVWTGKEMVIWGGAFYDPQFHLFNDGGRYDPESDSWRPINTNGSPSGRWLHSAVWTGKEMIVWGGQGSENLQDGARYDPTTDTWMPMTTNGAPIGRTSATAIWTGTEMIVWGGATSLSSPGLWLGDGGRYDPNKDTWRPLANVGGPSERGGHTAVWTGNEMLVWAGTRNGSTNDPFSDGASYDPLTDRWAPITQTGRPVGRAYHTALWTGTGMLIFGGRTSAGAPRSDFAVYNPRPPQLSITSADNATATIQWPFPSTDFRLQHTSGLGVADWANVQSEVSRKGATWFHNVPSTNAAFFRLKEE